MSTPPLLDFLRILIIVSMGPNFNEKLSLSGQAVQSC